MQLFLNAARRQGEYWSLLEEIRLNCYNWLITGLTVHSYSSSWSRMLLPGLWQEPKKAQYITPGLRSLQWPPVSHRISFKTLLLVFRLLNRLGPRYLPDITLAGCGLLAVPRVKTKYCEAAFNTFFEKANKKLWDSAETELMKSKLKTYFFTMIFN